MKFGEQLLATLIPEWEGQYVDYETCKKMLKKGRLAYEMVKTQIEAPKFKLSYDEAEDQLVFGSLPCVNIPYQFVDDEVTKVNAFFILQSRNFIKRTRDLCQDVDLFSPKQLALLDTMELELNFAEVNSSRSKASFVGGTLRKPQELKTVTERFNQINSQQRPTYLQLNKRVTMAQLRVHKKKVVKQARKAFLETYRCWSYLQSFTKLNLQACSKILKKADKLLEQDMKKQFFPLIEKEYCFETTSVQQILSAMEEVWVTQLSPAKSRHEAMDALREVQMSNLEHRQNHSLVDMFWIGWWAALLLYSVMQPVLQGFNVLSPLVNGEFGPAQAFTRGMGLSILMTWGWGLNAFVWHKVRINFGYIFMLPFGIGYAQILKIAAFMTFVWIFFVYCLVAPEYFVPNLDVSEDAWLLTAIVLFAAMFALPVPVFQANLRSWLVKNVRDIVFRPGLKKVLFKEFWMTDQFTSMGVVFADMYYLGCHTIVDFGRDSDRCIDQMVYVRPTIVALPLALRFFQCLRKYHDQPESKTQLYNAGKYTSGMITAAMSAAFSITGDEVFRVLWIITASIAFCYTYYWDVNHDWGYFTTSPRDRAWPLRAGLKYTMDGTRTWIYYVPLVTNAFLRLMWVFSVSDSHWINNSYGWSLLNGALGVFRRIQWNFLRVEYEHTHNAEKYRAVEDVPMPRFGGSDPAVTKSWNPFTRWAHKRPKSKDDDDIMSMNLQNMHLVARHDPYTHNLREPLSPARRLSSQREVSPATMEMLPLKPLITPRRRSHNASDPLPYRPPPHTQPPHKKPKATQPPIGRRKEARESQATLVEQGRSHGDRQCDELHSEPRPDENTSSGSGKESARSELQSPGPHVTIEVTPAEDSSPSEHENDDEHQHVRHDDDPQQQQPPEYQDRSDSEPLEAIPDGSQLLTHAEAGVVIPPGRSTPSENNGDDDDDDDNDPAVLGLDQSTWS